jgi:hypothetical protein
MNLASDKQALIASPAQILSNGIISNIMFNCASQTQTSSFTSSNTQYRGAEGKATPQDWLGYVRAGPLLVPPHECNTSKPCTNEHPRMLLPQLLNPVVRFPLAVELIEGLTRAWLRSTKHTHALVVVLTRLWPDRQRAGDGVGGGVEGLQVPLEGDGPVAAAVQHHHLPGHRLHTRGGKNKNINVHNVTYIMSHTWSHDVQHQHQLQNELGIALVFPLDIKQATRSLRAAAAPTAQLGGLLEQGCAGSHNMQLSKHMHRQWLPQKLVAVPWVAWCRAAACRARWRPAALGTWPSGTD